MTCRLSWPWPRLAVPQLRLRRRGSRPGLLCDDAERRAGIRRSVPDRTTEPSPDATMRCRCRVWTRPKAHHREPSTTAPPSPATASLDLDRDGDRVRRPPESVLGCRADGGAGRRGTEDRQRERRRSVGTRQDRLRRSPDVARKCLAGAPPLGVGRGPDGVRGKRGDQPVPGHPVRRHPRAGTDAAGHRRAAGVPPDVLRAGLDPPELRTGRRRRRRRAGVRYRRRLPAAGPVPGHPGLVGRRVLRAGSVRDPGVRLRCRRDLSGRQRCPLVRGVDVSHRRDAVRHRAFGDAGADRRRTHEGGDEPGETVPNG